ncbi:MAG TPA: ABC transporter permease [Candidatus Elarobacter sp.]|nr:ABC transporter permease [Candidatus Elarobacter sp.]
MNTLAVVFNAEFVRRMRSRAYLAGTVVGAVGIIAVTVLPTVLTGVLSNSSRKIVLAGPPSLTAPAREALAHDYDVTAVVPRLPATPNTAFLDAHGKAAAAVELAKGASGLRVTAYARDPSTVGESLSRDLGRLQLALALGIPTARVDAGSKLHVTVHDVNGRFADTGAADAAKGVAYLFVILLYLAILLNAQAIMTSVAEEKTSRIAELLVAMLDPSRLLAAKILAAAATSFIQLAIWIVAGIGTGRLVASFVGTGAAASGRASGTLLGNVDVSAWEIVALLAFFAVGFAQYGVLYAAAASLINRTEDLGSVAGPLVVPVVFAFVLAVIGLGVPSSPAVVAASMIPLLSPFVMFTRIATSNVPAWQFVLSFVLDVVAALVLAWAAGKIYRVGLLLYGRPPSLRQIIATLRS